MSLSPTSSTIEVRLATATDLAALEANETDKTRGLSASYLRRQAEGGYYVVVGLIDGELGGRVILDCRDDEATLVPEMKLLWVFPKARRRGLGAALSEHLEQLASSLGYEEIFLGVTPDNPAAIPLYVGLGYSPTGDHRSAVNLSVIDPISSETGEATEAIYRKSLRVR